MAKNHYFLFGRNCDTNEVKAIPFSRRGEISNVEHSLEDIDNYTNAYQSEADLTLSLYQNGKIDGYNYDLFIVSRNGNRLTFLEPIYASFMYSKRIHNITSTTNGLDLYGEPILDHVIKKMYYQPNFYRFLAAGNTNVYKKFIDYFKKRDDLKEMFNYKYKDGSWMYQSYPLIRNIVEAIYRYDEYNNHPGSDIQYQEKMKARGDLSDQIMVLTDPNYIDGQQSIFDIVENEDPFDYVMEHLDMIDKDTIIMNDKGYQLNVDKLSTDVDPLFLEEIKGILPQSLMALFFGDAYSRYYLDNNLGYDYFQILDEYHANHLALIQVLKNNSSLLNRAYSFLLLYNKCKSVGEANGREKRKDPS